MSLIKIASIGSTEKTKLRRRRASLNQTTSRWRNSWKSTKLELVISIS